jgi:hypothetical protein
MFSLIYAVLLHPFPYADADRIMNPHIIGLPLARRSLMTCAL